MKPIILPFLADLQRNNDRDWFQKNKKRYEEARREFEEFVNLLIEGIGKFDESVKYNTAKESIFRIFRDVRFSNDKSPYKTNFGAWITKGGRKNSGPGYYIHIQPGQSFISGGVYMPDPEVLKKIRQEIFYNFKEFNSILGEKKVKKLFGGMDEFDKQKLAVKGYEKDFEGMEIIKNRHYILTLSLTDEDIKSDQLLKKAIDGYQTMKPFQDFLRRAIE